MVTQANPDKFRLSLTLFLNQVTCEYGPTWQGPTWQGPTWQGPTWQGPKGSQVTTAYGVFVLQLIRHARVCSKYEVFLFRGSILVSKLLKQGYSSRLLFEDAMIVIQTLFTNLTPLCHIC